MLASGSEEPSEARAGTIRIVAFTTARAVTASLAAVSVKRVSSRGALLEIARRTSVSLIADATNVLHGIPRGAVCTVGTAGKVLLGPASSTIVTVVRADGTLAGNSLISGKALALSSVAVAKTLVGALGPGMKVVGVDHITDPGEILGASAQRAIGAGPLGLAVNAGVALAVVVELAGAVSRALVLAHAGAAVASLVPGVLATSSPGLVLERRLAGRHGGGLAGGLSRHGSRLTTGQASGDRGGSTKGAHNGGEHNNSSDHLNNQCEVCKYDLGQYIYGLILCNAT